MQNKGLKWQIRGTYNESCASEGQCPFYLGRDKEGGCQYFMVIRIQAGWIDDVDISGTDFHRCTQIQKPMKPIACGEKKTGSFLPADEAALHLPPSGGPKLINL